MPAYWLGLGDIAPGAYRRRSTSHGANSLGEAKYSLGEAIGSQPRGGRPILITGTLSDVVGVAFAAAFL